MGVLTVNSTELGYFSPRRIQMLTAIASGIGTFVENANLREAERLHMVELDQELHAALKSLALRLSEAPVGEPASASSPEKRVLRYLDDHPEGAGFDTLQKAAEVSARVIVVAMATLIDTGKARQDFPLFFAVNASAN